MYKKFMIFILISLVVIMVNISSGTETVQRIIAAFNHEIRIELNGETFKAIDDDGTVLKPIIYDGRTYLPLKALAEALNADVDWNPDNKTITIQQVDPNLGIPYKDDDNPGDNTSPTVSNPAPKVYAKVVEGKIKIYWDKISSSSFQGYKVVASLSNAQPIYPNDGYAAYITDASTTYFYMDANTSYNGGDIGGKFVSGKKYYFSVTALYSNAKVRGNTIELIMP